MVRLFTSTCIMFIVQPVHKTKKFPPPRPHLFLCLCFYLANTVGYSVPNKDYSTNMCLGQCLKCAHYEYLGTCIFQSLLITCKRVQKLSYLFPQQVTSHKPKSTSIVLEVINGDMQEFHFEYNFTYQKGHIVH